MYLSFDPGQTTGWCKFDDLGNATQWGQASFEELMDLCKEWEKEKWTAIIYEDFILFSKKARQQAGSRMPASQAIGIIKTLIHATGATAIRQSSDIKSGAEKLTQMKAPSNHAESHWVDAFNHGAYYLIKKGIRKSFLEMEMEQKRKKAEQNEV